MSEATPIPLDRAALTISSGADGVWLHFSASNGRSASINIDGMTLGRIGVAGSALRCWCDDRRASLLDLSMVEVTTAQLPRKLTVDGWTMTDYAKLAEELERVLNTKFRGLVDMPVIAKAFYDNAPTILTVLRSHNALIGALNETLTAWNALPAGDHPPQRIETWLKDDMKPAMSAICDLFAGKPQLDPPGCVSA